MQRGLFYEALEFSGQEGKQVLQTCGTFSQTQTFFVTMPRGTQDLSSLTRVRTRDPFSGSSEFQLLDGWGSPQTCFFNDYQRSDNDTIDKQKYISDSPPPSPLSCPALQWLSSTQYLLSLRCAGHSHCHALSLYSLPALLIPPHLWWSLSTSLPVFFCCSVSVFLCKIILIFLEIKNFCFLFTVEDEDMASKYPVIPTYIKCC